MNFLNGFWSSLTSPTKKSRLRDVFLGLFLLGFLVRVTAVIITAQYTDLQRYELERIAISLATSGVYGNPYAIPTGPSAHVSPGYTLLLAALFRIFGTGQSAEIIKQVLACAVTAFQAALLPVLTRVFGLDFRAGLLAGLISALLPLKLMTETIGDWDSPWVALFLMFLCAATVYVWKRGEFSKRNALLTGTMWGISLLFGSALLTLYFVLLAVGVLIARQKTSRNYAVFCLIQTSIVALFLAPWAIRNERALGSPILSRSNLGLELRLSNNDYASPQELANYMTGVYQRFHPFFNLEEAQRIKAMGEIAYNRVCLLDAEQWAKTHPKRFIELISGRVLLFWLFQYSSKKAVYYFLTRSLGLIGVFYLLRHKRVTGLVLLLVLAIFPLPYYLVQFSTRYSFPIDWILTLTMSVLVVHIIDTASRRSTNSAQSSASWSSAKPRVAPPAPVS